MGVAFLLCVPVWALFHTNVESLLLGLPGRRLTNHILLGKLMLAIRNFQNTFLELQEP